MENWHNQELARPKTILSIKNEDGKVEFKIIMTFMDTKQGNCSNLVALADSYFASILFSSIRGVTL